jgi:parvulin-like peptidyl-prolyl isomerase
LIYQEARHELKDKKLTDLVEIADNVWRENELPPLLRANLVTTEQQLRLKMEESGRSVDALRLSHRQDFIAMLYVQQKLKDKLNVELPEMLKYYNAHIHDKSNYRPARITWRELVVETAKHASPADARLKAEGLLNRLQRGEDLARLAKAESDGPSAVKAQGGLMETSPGGYAVAAVNSAIETMPIGVVSGVIEGPTSFHIVRVERRRPAGPASFAELQDQIRRDIYTEKSTRERRQLLDKLHANNVVASIFDGTESDPNKVQR